MKLLILTQKVDLNDDVLGFFHGWLLEFAKHFEAVTVICLQKGELRLPPNVKVLSLGKENGFSRLKYIYNFYKYIFKEKKNYDKVFVHMNPVYIVLGGIFWKIWWKKIGLWYVHKNVDLKLRMANMLADIVFTSSKESYNLKNTNLKIVGHGILIDDFRFPISEKKDDEFIVVYAGRISRIKNQKLLINSLDELINQKGFKNIKAKIIGPVVYGEDKEYKKELENLLEKKNLKDFVEISEPAPFKGMPEIYSRADLSINLCPTGGVDKAVLESMAAGVPVIVLNKSFKGMLEEKYILGEPDKNKLAEKIEAIMNSKNKVEEGRNLREIVEKNFDLKILIQKIAGSL